MSSEVHDGLSDQGGLEINWVWSKAVSGSSCHHQRPFWFFSASDTLIRVHFGLGRSDQCSSWPWDSLIVDSFPMGPQPRWSLHAYFPLNYLSNSLRKLPSTEKNLDKFTLFATKICERFEVKFIILPQFAAICALCLGINMVNVFLCVLAGHVHGVCVCADAAQHCNRQISLH